MPHLPSLLHPSQLLWLVLLGTTQLQAAPAPFYLWQSSNGHFSCAQRAPGAAWERHSGPFRDAGCRVPADAPVRPRLL